MPQRGIYKLDILLSYFYITHLFGLFQSPTSINCNGGATYRYFINGTATSSYSDSRSAEFHLEGDQQFNFVVKAKNSAGLESSLTIKTGRSGKLGK